MSELQKPFGISQPAISRHLKILEAAGLIEQGRAAQSRPRRLRIDALKEPRGWFDEMSALWRESFERLDALLLEEEEEDRGGR